MAQSCGVEAHLEIKLFRTHRMDIRHQVADQSQEDRIQKEVDYRVGQNQEEKVQQMDQSQEEVHFQLKVQYHIPLGPANLYIQNTIILFQQAVVVLVVPNQFTVKMLKIFMQHFMI